MAIFLRIVVSVGAVFVATLAIMYTTTDARMYAGLGTAFLLLVAGNAPASFRKIVISIAGKFFNMKGA